MNHGPHYQILHLPTNQPIRYKGDIGFNSCDEAKRVMNEFHKEEINGRLETNVRYNDCRIVARHGYLF